MHMISRCSPVFISVVDTIERTSTFYFIVCGPFKMLSDRCTSARDVQRGKFDAYPNVHAFRSFVCVQVSIATVIISLLSLEISASSNATLKVHRLSRLSSISRTYFFRSEELFLFIHAYKCVLRSVPILPPLAVVSVTCKVYRVPEPKDSKDAASRSKERMKLTFHDVDHDGFTEVGRATRFAHRDAFLSRPCG